MCSEMSAHRRKVIRVTDRGRAADDAVRGSIEEIRSAYLRAAKAIDNAPVSREAFDLATTLRDSLDELQGEAAELRGHAARRIWESEELSLASLADRVGVSKARAAQFVRSGERQPTRRNR
jgi:hypothetical protein